MLTGAFRGLIDRSKLSELPDERQTIYRIAVDPIIKAAGSEVAAGIPVAVTSLSPIARTLGTTPIHESVKMDASSVSKPLRGLLHTAFATPLIMRVIGER